MKKQAIIFIILFFFPLVSLAHPGRTDSSGCHTCRTNCANWGLSTGEYHCHNAKALPQPEEPIHSKYGENGTGYTYPAPEYKKTDPTPIPTKSEPAAVLGEKVENTNENKISNTNQNYALPVASTNNQNTDQNDEDDNSGAAVFWTLAIVGGGIYAGKKIFKKK